jgi:hypothetical protein
MKRRLGVSGLYFFRAIIKRSRRPRKPAHGLQLASEVHGPHLGNLHVKPFLNFLANLKLIGVRVDLEGNLVELILHARGFLC